MDPVIHANILELLGAFALGFVIAIVIVWSLWGTPDDLDYDDSDEPDDDIRPDAPALVPQ